MVSIGKAYAIEHYHRQYYRPSRALQIQRTLTITHQIQMVRHQMIIPAGTRISKFLDLYIYEVGGHSKSTEYIQEASANGVCAILKENRLCFDLFYINNLHS